MEKETLEVANAIFAGLILKEMQETDCYLLLAIGMNGEYYPPKMHMVGLQQMPRQAIIDMLQMCLENFKANAKP